MRTHNYALYADKYSEIGIEGSYYLAFRDVPAILRRYGVKGHVLDYGCGSGRSTRFLKHLGLSVVGVDICESMLDGARRSDPSGEYHLIQSAHVPFPDESFDMVFSSFVFLEVPSIEEITAILSELRRVVKKDGIILFITSILTNHKDRYVSFNYDFEENNVDLTESCHKVKLQITDKDILFYDYNYTVDEYLQATRSAGLTVQSIDTPIGNRADPVRWLAEKEHPYFHVFTLNKDNTPHLLGDLCFMELTAKKMEMLSQQYCTPTEIVADPMKNKSNDDGCGWYHAAWGYCRYLGLIASPDLHEDCYRAFFANRQADRELNILISGAADFTVVEHLLEAVPEAFLPKLHITVLDMCLTPLNLCAWYDRQRMSRGGRGVQIWFMQLNAMDTQLPAGSIDLIATYSFLSRFDTQGQKKVLAEWRRLLKADGAVITSDRISPEYGAGFFESTPEQVAYFTQLAKKRLEEMPNCCLDRQKILGLAHTYAQNISSHSWPTTEAMTECFTGFDCQITTRKVQGELEPEETYAVLFAERKSVR